MGWQPISTAPTDGTLCALRFTDRFGSYDAAGPFFLHDDGRWYLVEPPRQVTARPSHWALSSDAEARVTARGGEG